MSPGHLHFWPTCYTDLGISITALTFNSLLDGLTKWRKALYLQFYFIIKGTLGARSQRWYSFQAPSPQSQDTPPSWPISVVCSLTRNLPQVCCPEFLLIDSSAMWLNSVSSCALPPQMSGYKFQPSNQMVSHADNQPHPEVILGPTLSHLFHITKTLLLHRKL